MGLEVAPETDKTKASCGQAQFRRQGSLEAVPLCERRA